MSLAQIVDIQISRGSRVVSRPGFGVPMILGQHTAFPERIRFYETIEAVAEDFLTSDAEYKFALAALSQELKPSRIAIGKRLPVAAQVVTYTPVVQNNALYTVTINGNQVSYTSDADATAAEIVAGLIAALNVFPTSQVITASGTTTLIITSDTAGLAFTYSASANLTGVLTTPNQGVQEDILQIIDSGPTGDEWYALLLTSKDPIDIELAGRQIESLKKIFIACDDESLVLSNDPGSIANTLKDFSLTRTAFLYSDDEQNGPEAAWAGGVLPLDPGSETWKFKTLAGITPDNGLTATQELNIKTQNANYYKTIAGVPIVQEGWMVSGEYIDVIRGIDWLEANMAADVFGLLVSVPKVPFTDAGIAQIESVVRARLIQAVRVGLLSSFELTVPRVADVPQADRAIRKLPDIRFSGVLAGAIHEVEIRGVVSV